MAKIKNESSRVVAKLGPLLISLDQTLKETDMKSVPTIMYKRLKDLSAKLNEYHDEARDKLARKEPLDLSFASSDLSPFIKDAVQTRNLVQNMLTNVRKLK